MRKRYRGCGNGHWMRMPNGQMDKRKFAKVRREERVEGQIVRNNIIGLRFLSTGRVRYR